VPRIFWSPVYQEWARAIIGSPPWRSADVARGELGWHLSGFARAVVDVAARRARLWLLSGTDLYRSIFLLAGCGATNSWAAKSKRILERWDIPDYCDWEGGAAPLHAYLKFVKEAVAAISLAKWKLAVAAHDRPVAYLELSREPSCWPTLLLKAPVAWDVLVGHISLARMRAGLIDLGHVGGRRSNASIRLCIGCGCRTRATFHDVSCVGGGRPSNTG
jgi:hypothetical protein